MKLKAPAKVNLTLEVLKHRDDGYHEIRSILQTIDLCDELELEESEEFEFYCDRQDLNNETNLALRAYRLLRLKTGASKSAHIQLKKHIPVAAGLGGGSSDAAAVIKGLNILWKLNLSMNKLMEIAAELGSDVPFFIRGGTALAKGRGEIIELLPSAGDYWFVMLIPPLETHIDKTSRMYRSLTEASYTKGEFTQALASRIKSGGEIELSVLYNVFDEVAPGIYPRLPLFKSLLEEEAGIDKAVLAGSGPCLYVMFRDEGRAKQLWHKLVKKDYMAYVAKTSV